MDAQIEAIDQKILTLLYLGYDQIAISRRIHASRRTVQRRIRDLMTALGAVSAVALGARAQALGLLPPDPVMLMGADPRPAARPTARPAPRAADPAPRRPHPAAVKKH